jgi:predicted MPP superfamily phosphohydrolase
VGTSMLPFRAFCRPEIVVFHLEAGRPVEAGR